MKKLLAVLLCMATLISCKKDEEQLIDRIPDPEFRSLLIIRFDTDMDFKLSNKEILAVDEIIIYDQFKIRSFEGIEIFKNLNRFYVNGMRIKTIDLSKNLNLTRVFAYNVSNLTTIYLSPSLENFISLDVSPHVSITYK